MRWLLKILDPLYAQKFCLHVAASAFNGITLLNSDSAWEKGLLLV